LIKANLFNTLKNTVQFCLAYSKFLCHPFDIYSIADGPIACRRANMPQTKPFTYLSSCS
jgi:hypothetical protein